MIEDLPILRPDAARGANTIARCHDRLAARRRKIERRQRQPDQGTAAVERLVLAGLCVVYLVAMAGDVLSIVSAL
jgi:hypothetical protein